jgi:hypothetical protein
VVNIGNEGVMACRGLKGNEQWDMLRAQLYKLAADRTDVALNSDPSARVDLTAYARALRDLWVALESATLELRHQSVDKPNRPIMTKGAA